MTKLILILTLNDPHNVKNLNDEIQRTNGWANATVRYSCYQA